MEQCVMFQEPAEDTDSEAREGSTDFRTKATEVKEILPCVPLRGVTIFPHTVVHFDIGREKSIRALERAMATDKLLFVSSQKDDRVVIPTVEDIYSLGTVVRVKQTLKIQGDAVRVLVEGICRATMDECITEENYISCTIDRIPETVTEEDLSAEDKAMLRYLAESFTEYARATSQISEDLVAKTLDTDNPADLVDSIANEIFVSTGKKQKVLEALVFSDRIRVLTELIAEENEIASLEKTVAQKVKENIDSGQRDYYLREKIKAIQSELGMDEDAAAETAEWLEKLDALGLEEKTDKKIRKEISKYGKMAPSSAESAVVRNYVETILDLPWHTSSETNSDIRSAEKILDADHYGMRKVKERILEYLAVTQLTNGIRGPILCLVGPPGVGKTSIAKSIARATGREFVRMSLGGVRDEAEIRGHRRTY
ncbi:MAG TPA: endopeptidase La, partial [Eubacterium sp.]|nr:endopeptidase La [Eubacterium sp.]